MMSPPGDVHAERFTLLRPLLFTIAYEILGSATESDDVLHEVFGFTHEEISSTICKSRPRCGVDGRQRRQGDRGP
jgi:DNA-directed RNA polymerase specialized sigma24 family protein